MTHWLLELPWPWPCCTPGPEALFSEGFQRCLYLISCSDEPSQCSLYSALVVQLAALKSFVWSVCAEVAGRGVGYTTPAADGQAAGLMAMLQLFWDLLFLVPIFFGVCVVILSYCVTCQVCYLALWYLCSILFCEVFATKSGHVSGRKFSKRRKQDTGH